jgi:hypothetical protein
MQADDIAKATATVEAARTANQTMLTALENYKQLSSLVKQAGAFCVAEPANATNAENKSDTTSPNKRKSTSEPKERLDRSLNKVVKRSRPILYPSGRSLESMLDKFERVCAEVKNGEGRWGTVRKEGLDVFNQMGYGEGPKGVQSLFHLLWFAAAALTQHLNHDWWNVDFEMEPLLEAINMLNAIEFE